MLRNTSNVKSSSTNWASQLGADHIVSLWYTLRWWRVLLNAWKICIWTAEKDVKKWLIIALIHSTSAVVKLKTNKKKLVVTFLLFFSYCSWQLNLFCSLGMLSGLCERWLYFASPPNRSRTYHILHGYSKSGITLSQLLFASLVSLQSLQCNLKQVHLK